VRNWKPTSGIKKNKKTRKKTTRSSLFRTPDRGAQPRQREGFLDHVKMMLLHYNTNENQAKGGDKDRKLGRGRE